MTAQRGQEGQTTAPLPLHATVLPVLPGISQEVTTTVRGDVAQAVTFLEEVTELRYYPAPTLLVDDYAIKSVRSLNTVDLPPANNAHEEEILALTDIVQSLCLCFHVEFGLRNILPETVDTNNVSSYLGSGSVLTETQFKAIKYHCEAAIHSWIEDYFVPSWQRSLSSLDSKLPNIRIGQNFSNFVIEILDKILMMMQERAKSSGTKFEIFLEDSFDVWTHIQTEAAATGITGTKVDSWQGNFVLKGTFPAFVQTLVSLRKVLAKALPEYNNSDRTSATNPDDAGIHCLAIAREVGSICHEINDGFLGKGELDIFKQSGITLEDGNKLTGSQCGLLIDQCSCIKGWIEDVIQPGWRQIRNELLGLNLGAFHSGLSFVGFITTFLKTVHTLMQTGLQNVGDFEYRDGFSIRLESWQLLQKEQPALQLQAEPVTDRKGQEVVFLKGSFSEFIRVFDEASRRLTEALSQGASMGSPTQQLFLVTVPTYGIYAPPDSRTTDEALQQWALKRGVPVQFTLPQSPRVLLCLSARQRFEEQLALEQDNDSAELAKLFQLCTLIHEHFHAILAIGLDSNRALASGSQLASWQTASPLNESLAVWMELHFARENPKLTDLIWSYIRAGSYPDWPYRGAEYIENLYQEKAMEAVRELITEMRQRPEAAQAKLNALS